MTEAEIARFWSLVDKRGPDECWEWRGTVHLNSARFNYRHHQVTAARIMLELVGRAQPGFRVKQTRTCGNWRCVNPAHLVVEPESRPAPAKRRPTIHELAARVGARLVAVGNRRYRVEMGANG